MNTYLIILACFLLNCIDYSGHWYYSKRLIDLNNDNKLDTVIIQADGPSSDNLSITLSFIVDGKEVWDERWNSNYELVDPPDFEKDKVNRDNYIRLALQKTLSGISIDTFCMSDYLGMARSSIDTSIVNHPPKFQLSFSYGYESTIVLYWDSTACVFRKLWDCC